MRQKQSEALQLADLLCGIDVGGMKNAWLNKAAAELRRLHAENAELLQALKAVSVYDSYETEYDGRMYDICPSCGKQDDDEHSESCSFSPLRS